MEVAMLSERDLRELNDYSAVSSVLSVYLSTDPSEGNADAWKLRLRNMLKEVDLPQDTAAVEHFIFHAHDWSGRGVIIFSCAPEKFFKAYTLSLPVRDQVSVGSRPGIKQLAELLENFGGYGVALIDKQGARVFNFHLGELREQEGVAGEIVKHTKRGGASSFPGRRGGIAGRTRYQEELVDRNIKDAVEFTVRFFEEKRIRRVLLCGSDENIALFKANLPKKWLDRVVGSFSASMLESHTEILAKTIQVGKIAEMARENTMIEELITSAAKGTSASVGLENTLRAISSSRVQKLLVSIGFSQPLQKCQTCGHVTSHSGVKCSACSGRMEKIPEGIEMAVSSVLRSGGEVEIVHPTAAFNRAGGIGAYLRY
jgi:hypothetical protein